MKVRFSLAASPRRASVAGDSRATVTLALGSGWDPERDPHGPVGNLYTSHSTSPGTSGPAPLTAF